MWRGPLAARGWGRFHAGVPWWGGVGSSSRHRPTIVGCTGGKGHPQSPRCRAGGNPRGGTRVQGTRAGEWPSPRGAGTLPMSPVSPVLPLRVLPERCCSHRGCRGVPPCLGPPVPSPSSSPSLSRAARHRHPRPAWPGPGPRAVPAGHRARNTMTSEASGVTGRAAPPGEGSPFQGRSGGAPGMRGGRGGDVRPLLPVSQCAGAL